MIWKKKQIGVNASDADSEKNKRTYNQTPIQSSFQYTTPDINIFKKDRLKHLLISCFRKEHTLFC
jgi:hypothetical protein